MENPKYVSHNTPLQLHPVNQRRGQKDNSELIRKINIRNYLTRNMTKGNLFLAGCGFGQMFKNSWREKAAYTLALDTNTVKVNDFFHHFPKVDIRCADASTFVDWPSNIQFQIADFDAFGDPYPAIKNFFQHNVWKTPLVIVVGDARLLHFRWTGSLSTELWKPNKKGKYRGLRKAETYIESFVWPWWTYLARKNNLHIIERMCVFNRRKTVAYYGLQLESSL